MQLPAGVELGNKINKIRIGVCLKQLTDEGMIQLRESLIFSIDTHHFNHCIWIVALEGRYLRDDYLFDSVRVLLLHQEGIGNQVGHFGRLNGLAVSFGNFHNSIRTFPKVISHVIKMINVKRLVSC